MYTIPTHGPCDTDTVCRDMMSIIRYNGREEVRDNLHLRENGYRYNKKIYTRYFNNYNIYNNE